MTNAAHALPKPTVREAVELRNASGLVGYYQVERSLRGLLYETLFVALIGCLLALIIAIPLRTLPLRALRKAFLELEQEREKALIPLASIADAVIMTNAQMVVEYLNPSAEKLTGWTAAQAKGLHVDEVFTILNERTREPAHNPIRACLATNEAIESKNHPILVRRSDHEEFYVEESAAPIRKLNNEIVGAVMVFRDVTDRKVAQNLLHHIAFHDALTELPNRAFFQKKLSQAMESACLLNRHVAVLFMDLDRFKTINDSLGHVIGDELLVLVGRRLRRCVRDSDTVSRMGGDEFTAVLKDLPSIENAGIVAGKILNELSKPFTIQGQELRISTSIGITIYPQDGESIDTLLKNADTAMYHAKAIGRNNFQYFVASMSTKAVETLQLENALRTALEKKEYFLEYQPKLELKTDQIVGVEVLLRWQSPKLGRIMPSEFIPILEESGMILQVGNWVLKTAIRQARKWLDSGHPLLVSVNASALQFGQHDFVDDIAAMLQSAGLPPELLRIEVTESLLMEDSERNESVMKKLVDLGVTMSLDDFGTGYSSLSYLQRFPIAELKIDSSFIADITDNQTAEKVVKTIIDLGQALDMTVTAEGVETQEQRMQLQRMGCDEMQGYLLSRAIGSEEVEALISRRKNNYTNTPH